MVYMSFLTISTVANYVILQAQLPNAVPVLHYYCFSILFGGLPLHFATSSKALRVIKASPEFNFFCVHSHAGPTFTSRGLCRWIGRTMPVIYSLSIYSSITSHAISCHCPTGRNGIGGSRQAVSQCVRRRGTNTMMDTPLFGQIGHYWGGAFTLLGANSRTGADCEWAIRLKVGHLTSRCRNGFHQFYCGGTLTFS